MEKCDFILEFKGIDNYQGEQKEICRSGNAAKWDNSCLAAVWYVYNIKNELSHKNIYDNM